MTIGYKHGLRYTPEYKVWIGMRQRCNNPQGHDVEYYAGVCICPEWGDVRRFIMDMGERPSVNHQIDRTDNTKGYSKDNCEWVDRPSQMRNTRISKWWYVDGVRYESTGHACSVLNTTPSRIKAWCDGRTDGGYTYPPRVDCWSEKKYA